MAVPGAVRLVEHLGRETILYVDAAPLRCTGSDSGTGNLTLQSGALLGLKAGQAVQVSLDPCDAYLFSTDGRHCLTPRKAPLR